MLELSWRHRLLEIREGDIKIAGGVDKGDVGEGLGEVAQGLAGLRVHHLREQAEVVGAGKDPLEELLGLLQAAEEDEAIALAEDRVKIVVGSGGNGTSGTFYVTIG